MAKLFNRAKMTTSTTGTGTITLGSASNGFQSFADAGVANGDVVQYVIEEGSNFEIGTGTYSSSGTALTRTPTESSNSDSAITLAGQATVSITAVAADLNRLQHNGSDKVTVSSTGASVAGNISVTGNVDGRDIATDGSKLDGIESGATADQTASEILTAIKTVDGSGSGLDADTLDGSHASAFLTGNQTITLSGDVSGSGTTSISVSVVNDSHTHDGRYYTESESDLRFVNVNGDTLTGGLRQHQVSHTASGGTHTINLSNSNNHYVTLTANTTLAFSNVDAGRNGNIIIKQNATGGYSFTLPSVCKTPVNGASIVQSTGANEISILAYYVVDSSTILVNYIGDFA